MITEKKEIILFLNHFCCFQAFAILFKRKICEQTKLLCVFVCVCVYACVFFWSQLKKNTNKCNKKKLKLKKIACVYNVHVHP